MQLFFFLKKKRHAKTFIHSKSVPTQSSKFLSINVYAKNTCTFSLTALTVASIAILIAIVYLQSLLKNSISHWWSTCSQVSAFWKQLELKKINFYRLVQMCLTTNIVQNICCTEQFKQPVLEVVCQKSEHCLVVLLHT